jgi:hypothetical protein
MSKHPNSDIPVASLPPKQQWRVERAMKRIRKRKDRQSYLKFTRKHRCDMEYPDCELRGWCNGDC